MSSTSTAQQRLQALTAKFSSVQEKLQETIKSRQKVESQVHENHAVQTEFGKLDDDAAIYKLVGPVLVKQDSLEANQNVARRIELLESETKRIEEDIKRYQNEAEQIKNEIIKLQQESLAQETAQSNTDA